MKKVIIHYHTRDLGYGTEEGTFTAYITGEVDTWGKHTVLIQSGRLFETLYLFPDEYEIVEEASDEN